MATPKKIKKVADRYAQLTPERRAALTAKKVEISLHPDLGSFTGPAFRLKYFEAALATVKASCALLGCGRALIIGFVGYCNSPGRDSNRAFEIGASQLINGVILYLRDNGLNDIGIGEIDERFVNGFIFWLKNLSKNGKRLSENTARRYFGTFREVMEKICISKQYKLQVSKYLVFPVNAFPEAHQDELPTEVIDDVTFLAIQRACIMEIEDTIGAMRNVLDVLAKEPVQPDLTRRGRGRYGDFEAAVWAYADIFQESISKETVPFMRVVRAENKDLAEAIQHLHGFESVVVGFFPRASQIFPFVLLLAIYSMANTGPLRSLSLNNISEKDLMGIFRISFGFVKGRGGKTYSRTFAVDETSPFSPGELVKFLKLWTANIRSAAGSYANHLFLFATSFGSVRGFNTARDNGSDSDSLWNSAAKIFFEKYQLPKVNLREIRFTAGDIVRELSADDVRAVKAVMGHFRVSTNEIFYDSSGAKRRRDEGLSEVQNAQQRWALTKGKIDIRTGMEQINFLAATPGFECIDPYNSPVPGEVAGRLCQGYCRCPACPHAMTMLVRAYSLARLVQVRTEMDKARLYLHPARWEGVYQESREKLDDWIRGFSDPKVIEEAEEIELHPLAPLE